MIPRQNKIVGFFLLFCFAFAIVPPELIHEHHWESEICKEQELHFSDHSIDCDLADYYISKSLNVEKSQLFNSDYLLTEYTVQSIEVSYSKELQLHKVRGPPELA